MISRPRAKLLDNYITKGGNLYNGNVVYEPNILPEEIYLNKPHLLQVLDPSDQVVRQVEQLSTDVDLSPLESKAVNATKVTKITPEVVEVISAPVETLNQVEVVPPQILEYTYLNTTPIQINTIDEASFIDVKGLGAATFKKVKEAREASPILNMSDLSDRIDMSGRWAKYSIDFSIPE
jgi:hypothetical protein